MATKTRDEVRAEYDNKLAALRERKDLSDDGRRAHVAGIYQDARQGMRAIRDQEDAEADSRRTALQQKLFGNPGSDPSSVVSYRDALDRAGSLGNPEQALDLLHRADMTGDAALGRAIAYVAAGKAVTPGDGWDQVLNAWAEPRGLTEEIDELRAIDAAKSPKNKLVRKMANSVPPPSELDGQADDMNLTRLRQVID